MYFVFNLNTMEWHWNGLLCADVPLRNCSLTHLFPCADTGFYTALLLPLAAANVAMQILDSCIWFITCLNTNTLWPRQQRLIVVSVHITIHRSFVLVFADRYRYAASTSVAAAKPDAASCSRLLENAGLKNWQIGHSKVLNLSSWLAAVVV